MFDIYKYRYYAILVIIETKWAVLVKQGLQIVYERKTVNDDR